MSEALPEFVSPMLAKLEHQAFDSDEHWFEIKWDGTRALSFIEGGDYRLLSRKQSNLKPRYPELEFLGSLPEGTLLDGEIVVLQDGKPDFPLLLSREQARDERRIANLARTHPATYVVFDILVQASRSLMKEPLSLRREALSEVVGGCSDPRLVLSDGVIGPGTAFFDEVRKLGLEGMLAKRLRSTYQPGRRTDAWQKIKTTQRLHCLILGYLPEGDDDIKSLVIATNEEAGGGTGLRSVGRVGSGLGSALRKELLALMRTSPRDEPLVPCGPESRGAVWTEPGLFCVVSFLEWTSNGELRAPVFEELVRDSG